MLHLTKENFMHETSECPEPAVVMFYASWCAKCAMMKPVVEELEIRHGSHVRFFQVDIDESPELSEPYDTSIVPVFVFFQGGEAIGAMQGIIDETTFSSRLNKIFRNT